MDPPDSLAGPHSRLHTKPDREKSVVFSFLFSLHHEQRNHSNILETHFRSRGPQRLPWLRPEAALGWCPGHIEVFGQNGEENTKRTILGAALLYASGRGERRND